MVLTFLQSLFLVLVLIFTTTLSPALANEQTFQEQIFQEQASQGQGAKVFDLYCAGCHGNGGNIVRRGKNLKLPALKRNGMDSIATIGELVKNGKNNMSAYGDRLSEGEIQAVAAYVLQRANQDWR